MVYLFNLWQEIGSTIRKNRLRTILTGLSVAWGIFMLIILLGAGNGLTNGMKENFAGDAVNSIWYYPRTTSLPYKGLQPGRRVMFENSDIEFIKNNFSEVDKISGRFFLPYDNVNISYKNEYSSYEVCACSPDYGDIEEVAIQNGRFLNDVDLYENRKVVVLGYEVKDKLFKEDDEPLGSYVKINNAMFRVIGIYRDVSNWDNKRVYIPISTAQMIFGGGNRIHTIAVTTNNITPKESLVLQDKIKNYLAYKHKFDPSDSKAMFVRNQYDNYTRTLNVFAGIKLFVWIIGIGTIIAGVVGVSNIMLITVKERTREIGIRKALGATPSSVIWMIIIESIVITAIAGYIGMLLGIGFTELINATMENALANAPRDPNQGTMFRNPTVDIYLALGATALLVVSGTLAGFFPARKAASIRPIEALREE